MIKLLLVGIGGFFGAISRFALGGLVYRLLADPWMPYGTLICNLTGCLAIGFFGGLVELRQIWSPQIRILVFIGFLGGFTTFSSLGFETFGLIREGQLLPAFFNIIISCLLGLILVWLGWNLSRLL